MASRRAGHLAGHQLLDNQAPTAEEHGTERTMKTIAMDDIQKQVSTLQVAERFFDSVVTFALLEVGIFRELATGPKTFEQLQGRVDGDAESLRAILDAAVALKVLQSEDGSYVADEAFLDSLGREDSPAYLGESIALLHALAMPLLRQGDEIREGSKPGSLFEDMSGDDLPAKRMPQAMDAYARTRGIEIADRLDFSATRRLIDLGCGPGTYSLAIVERNPQAQATLLDLPGPIAEARCIVEQRGMSDLVSFVTRDAMEYTPGEPFDTVLISNMLHMIGPERSRALLKHCHGMICPGGRIIIQAQYLNDDRTSPRWPTLLNLIQRVAIPHGRNHAIGETHEWLKEAGFTGVEFVRFSTWNVCSCLIGTKPAG